LAEGTAIGFADAVANKVEELDNAGLVLARVEEGFETAEEYLDT
jgi:hypothetical protein